MATLRLAQFSGEIPKLLPRLLPDSGSQYAENVRLDDGGLTPIRKLRLEETLVSEDIVRTIYNFLGEWLFWENIVNAVPGPVADDRLYYTGDGVPKMRIGSTVYNLAVPAPTAPLTAVLAGIGLGDVTTRLYVYTFVTEYGEESEPNPISADVDWQAGVTVTLSDFEEPPTDRAFNLQRIYRSQSSNQAGTDLFLIAERAASDDDFVDIYAPDQFGEILPSRDWNPPPDDLSGLIGMPNGMMAAFSGKQLCFCEPFQPHAWPEKYRLTAAHEIVGLGSYGTTVVAGTRGFPYIATGGSPDSMIEEKIEVNLPCINSRGVVDLGYSVAYPSNDGLVVVSNGGANVFTDSLFTRPQWQKLSPATIVAGQFAGRYFFSYEYIEVNDQIIEGTYIIDLTNQQPFVLRAAKRFDAFFYDTTTSQLFVLIDKEIYEWDAIGKTNEIMTWKSKRVVMNAPCSMGAILVEGKDLYSAEEIAAQQAELDAAISYNESLLALDSMGTEIDGGEIDGIAVNGDNLKRIPVKKFVSISVYADGELVKVVTELGRVRRFKSRRARIWEVKVNGTAEVEQISLATTVQELNGI